MEHATGKREWIYPLWVDGFFQKRRKVAFAALNLFLILTPWIRWNGEQLIRIDLPDRRLWVVGEVFSPADTIFVFLALLFSALLLFLVTSLWGRIWCGYACPQTVFLETFVHNVEHWIEGARGVKMKRDRGPWSFDKAWRKAAKWSIFLVASFFISMTFVSWFAGTHPLWTGKFGTGAYGSVAFFTGLMFLDLAWFREQFCNYLCPYARFQGVIADATSLIITYDEPRGEPRRGPEVAKEAQGHCIDCHKCVAVCPTGIDIREGYQLECIGCARCIDACAPIMAKLGHENLVGYRSGVVDPVKKKGPRLRPMIYGSALVAVAVIFQVLLVERHTLDVNLNRAPGTLYQTDEDGYTRNTYFLSVLNKKKVAGPATVEVSIRGMDRAEVVMPPLSLGTGEHKSVPLVIRTPPDARQERTERFELVVRTGFDEVAVPMTFKTGGPQEASHPAG